MEGTVPPDAAKEQMKQQMVTDVELPSDVSKMSVYDTLR